MRTLGIGTQEHTKIQATDEQNVQNKANHQYRVVYTYENNSTTGLCDQHFADISFQNGPVKEVGINGCHNEDLIAIVMDRLLGFQEGPYACDENDLALGALRLSLRLLRHRTEARKERGVEGTNAL